jgi:hypothetical protein
MSQAHDLRNSGPPASPAPRRPTHSADGVDLTLIRWMLSLTPAERLAVLQGTVRSILRLRNAALLRRTLEERDKT